MQNYDIYAIFTKSYILKKIARTYVNIWKKKTKLFYSPIIYMDQFGISMMENYLKDYVLIYIVNKINKKRSYIKMILYIYQLKYNTSF